MGRLTRPAWHRAEELIRSTARVDERSGDGWTWRGTAFFIGADTLLTCAHVAVRDPEIRVVWLGPDGPVALSVSIGERRWPDQNVVPGSPYPQPDVAVLRTTQQLPDHAVAWLSEASPGEDLWAFGYTDEYREGEALGHACRFANAGMMQSRPDGPLDVWRMQHDRVRGGMSGAPVLDLTTGRVVGLVKRTADPFQPLGAYFTPVGSLRGVIGAELDANDELNNTDARDDRAAWLLWGELVTVVSAALEGSAAARQLVAAGLGIDADELDGDDQQQAGRLAREFFIADLETVVSCVQQLRATVGVETAASVFDAVATCTSYGGWPWVGAEAAAELAEQVEEIARGDGSTGRVLHLRARDPELRAAYWHRGNRRRSWSDPLVVGPLSHLQDAASGLPDDIERVVRLAVLADYAQIPRYRRLAVDELDDAGRAAWDAERPKLVRQLCRQRVIGLLDRDTPLDPTLVAAIVRRYGLVFLAASDEEPSAELRAADAFQALDPAVDPDGAAAANALYVWARGRLEVAGR